MARYKVISNLRHNNTEFPVGSEVEFQQGDVHAARLVELKVIEKILAREEFKPTAEPKPIEKFHSPTSTAEIEKAAERIKNAPDLMGRCNKCKTRREIKNADISVNAKGTVNILGTCAVCGTKIHKIKGKLPKITQEKTEDTEEK